MTICAGPDCDRPARTRGLCVGHYRQLSRGLTLRPLRTPRTPTTCTGPDCPRTSTTRTGLCDTHQQQADRHPGEPLTPIGARTRSVNYGRTCTGPDCHRDARVGGLCDGHYRQQRRGAPLRPFRASQPRKPRAERRSPKPRRIPAPKPAPAKPVVLPDSWLKPSKPVKKPVRNPGGGLPEIPVVTPLSPETVSMARTNLIAHGGADLLDMLGLADVVEVAA